MFSPEEWMSGVGYDRFPHSTNGFHKLIDFSSSVFSLDNFQLSGEDGRGLWLQELCYIQVSGCRVIVLAEKCACFWSKGSSVCDESKNSHGLKVRSRQRWCLPVSCPILQEICNLKAVALSQFQFSDLLPFGKEKSEVREKKTWCLLGPPPTSQHTKPTCDLMRNVRACPHMPPMRLLAK